MRSKKRAARACPGSRSAQTRLVGAPPARPAHLAPHTSTEEVTRRTWATGRQRVDAGDALPAIPVALPTPIDGTVSPPSTTVATSAADAATSAAASAPPGSSSSQMVTHLPVAISRPDRGCPTAANRAGRHCRPTQHQAPAAAASPPAESSGCWWSASASSKRSENLSHRIIRSAL